MHYHFIEVNSFDKNVEQIGKNVELTKNRARRLPAELSGWIGDNQRDHYLSLVSNSRLKNAVNQLYRKSSIIGDGGTAAVIRFEKATGRNLGRNGKNHIQKGRDMLSYLNRIASSEKLSQSDRIIANKLISDLKTALGGK